jgi:hypothetical protein
MSLPTSSQAMVGAITVARQPKAKMMAAVTILARTVQ